MSCAENVRNMLERELKTVCESHKRQSLFDQLLNANQVPTPKSLVDQDVEQTLAGLRPAPPPDSEEGEAPEDTPEAEAPQETPEMRAEAERRVRLQLLVSELATREKITPDNQVLSGQLQALAASAPDPAAAFEEMAGNRELVGNLRAGIRQEQVLEWLYEQAKVSKQPMSFHEFMEPLPPVLTG